MQTCHEGTSVMLVTHLYRAQGDIAGLFFRVLGDSSGIIKSRVDMIMISTVMTVMSKTFLCS